MPLILIDLLENANKLEPELKTSFLATFPPFGADLNCLGGTINRLTKENEKIGGTFTNKAITEAEAKAYSSAQEDFLFNGLGKDNDSHTRNAIKALSYQSSRDDMLSVDEYALLNFAYVNAAVLMDGVESFDRDYRAIIIKEEGDIVEQKIKDALTELQELELYNLLDGKFHATSRDSVDAVIEEVNSVLEVPLPMGISFSDGEIVSLDDGISSYVGADLNGHAKTLLTSMIKEKLNPILAGLVYGTESIAPGSERYTFINNFFEKIGIVGVESNYLTIDIGNFVLQKDDADLQYDLEQLLEGRHHSKIAYIIEKFKITQESKRITSLADLNYHQVVDSLIEAITEKITLEDTEAEEIRRKLTTTKDYLIDATHTSLKLDIDLLRKRLVKDRLENDDYAGLDLVNRYELRKKVESDIKTAIASIGGFDESLLDINYSAVNKELFESLLSELDVETSLLSEFLLVSSANVKFGKEKLISYLVSKNLIETAEVKSADVIDSSNIASSDTKGKITRLLDVRGEGETKKHQC